MVVLWPKSANCATIVFLSSSFDPPSCRSCTATSCGMNRRVYISTPMPMARTATPSVSPSTGVYSEYRK